MLEIVMRHLVAEHKGRTLVGRQSLEELSSDVEVAAGDVERGERRDAQAVRDERNSVWPNGVESGHHAVETLSNPRLFSVRTVLRQELAVKLGVELLSAARGHSTLRLAVFGVALLAGFFSAMCHQPPRKLESIHGAPPQVETAVFIPAPRRILYVAKYDKNGSVPRADRPSPQGRLS